MTFVSSDQQIDFVDVGHRIQKLLHEDLAQKSRGTSDQDTGAIKSVRNGKAGFHVRD